MMQPATMLSRAEPTRRPWYSPTLTGFIQQVETPHLALTVPSHCASLLCFTATGNCTLIWSWRLLFPSLSLPQKHFLWRRSSSPWLKMSHASLKKKLGFLLLLKIRKLWGADSNFKSVPTTNLITVPASSISLLRMPTVKFSGPLVLLQSTAGWTIDQNIMTLVHLSTGMQKENWVALK